MKCFEEIFSGSIDCNWRNVSAGGLIAQNRVGKISHKSKKNIAQTELEKYILKFWKNNS